MPGINSREALCQLHDGDQVCGCGQVLAYSAECASLMFVGLATLFSGVHLDICGRCGDILLVDIGRANIATGHVTFLVGHALGELFVEPDGV